MRLIEGWTYRNVPAFDSSAGVDTNTPGYVSLENPLRIWWGAVRMVTGCTSLTVEGRGAMTSAEVLKVYAGGDDTSGSGTLLGTITLSGSAADFSQTFSISGLGWNDGDVKQIEIRAEGTHLGTASWIIKDVFLSPITKAGWVAAPSFSAVADATDAAKLNALCTAIDWVYARLRMTPIVPHLALYYNLGPFKTGDPQHTNRPIYIGSVGKYYNNTDLYLRGAVYSLTTTGWNYTISLDGTVVYTSPTYGIGLQSIEQRLSLASYTLGNRVQVSIRATCSNQGTANPLRFTRWTFGILHTVSSSTWPYATLPAAFTGPSATTNAETLRSRLASLATIVNNAKARIDARPELWARSRAMRRYFTRNTFTEDLLIARARPFFWQRTGNELFVKGKDVKVGVGPVTVKPDELSNGWEKYTFFHEESIDAQEGTTVFLDGIRGLDYGTAYRILGDPIYCAEYVG